MLLYELYSEAVLKTSVYKHARFLYPQNSLFVRMVQYLDACAEVVDYTSTITVLCVYVK